MIDYILDVTKCESNFIVSGIPTGYGFMYELAQWSKRNKDYVLVVQNHTMSSQMQSDGCEFEYIITNIMLTKIIEGKEVDSKLREMIDSGKIIMLESRAFKNLKRVNFFINLTTYPKLTFEKRHFNQANGTYWIETTGKEIHDFKYRIPQWKNMKIRDSKIDKLLDDEV